MNPRVSGSPGDGGGHCHPANATSRPLTLARPAASGKNSAEHAFRKRLYKDNVALARPALNFSDKFSSTHIAARGESPRCIRAAMHPA